MVVHPDAVQLAHQYTCAAAKQKKFLEYKHAFWEKSFGAYAASGGKDRASLGEGAILQYAPSFGADPAKLKADANSAECKQRIADDMAELAKFRVSGTPAFFINGKFIGGGIPKPAFQQIINEKLAIAEASKMAGAEYYAKEIMGKGSREFRSKRDAANTAPAPGPAEQAPGAGSAAQPGGGSAAKPAAPGADSSAKPGAGSAAKPAAAGAGSAAKPAAAGADSATKPAAPGAGSAAKPAAPGAGSAAKP